MSINDDDLIRMYRWMVLTRQFDQRVCELSLKGIPELQHASIGQEAVGVGTCYGLRPDDVILPSLRTRAAFLVKGITPNRIMTAMYGKANGAAHGKQTSHHYGEPELGVIAGSGVVGGSIPVATGAALALKMKGTDRVVLSFFGDGASNRGDFHEALNLAAVLKLPAIYICENNQVALSTPVARHMAIPDVAMRAGAYGMPGVVVDGNDVVAVYDATQQAVARARAGEGPTLIECKTYRWRGHSERDLLQSYRTKEEVAEWKARCPIKRLREQLLAKGAMTEQRLEEMDKDVAEEVERAVEHAFASPFPAPEEALNNVYATQVGSHR